jgi:GTP-binding protein
MNSMKRSIPGLPPRFPLPILGRMQIKSAVFVTSARGLSECPAWDRPEFAFIGRSNVGKSSMINLLANKEALAKVSATPGKTRMLNFFLLNDLWCLVDLPGYGFAKTAKSEKFDFNEWIGDYLEERANLRRVFVLIDSRLTPQRIDVEFTAWLGGTGVPFTLVFTKVDKQSAAKTRANIALFQESMSQAHTSVPDCLISSAKTRAGRNEILRGIEASLKP